mgnify:CR=1 FL=1
MVSDILYVGEPNRLLASGEETLDAVGLTFQVRSDGIRMEARTGPVSERTVELDYDEVWDVELVGEVSTGIRLETAETQYTVTNVTSSIREGRAVADEIRDRTDRVGGLGESGEATSVRRDDQRPTDGAETGRPDAGSPEGVSSGSERAVTDGSAPPTEPESHDETSLELDSGGEMTSGGPHSAWPGETIDCPRCGHETLVPDEIPAEPQDVVCPGCDHVIGHTVEGGEYVRIDPDSES